MLLSYRSPPPLPPPPLLALLLAAAPPGSGRASHPADHCVPRLQEQKPTQKEGDLCWGRYLSLSHRLSKKEGKETKDRVRVFPRWRKPPQCSQDPCGDPSHSLRLNSDPPLAKRQNDPRPPPRRGPSHLPGIISKPPT